jgi:hypothetical protein
MRWTWLRYGTLWILATKTGEVDGGGFKPIVESRKYKMADSATIREFYSLLRAPIKSARTVGHLKLLISDQTIPNIMGKIPHTYFETMGNLQA